jgi:hypothetical protein
LDHDEVHDGPVSRDSREEAEGKTMIYRRGKKGTYWMRFRFCGRIIHESTHTRRKTIAKDAEGERKKQLELRVNRLKRRKLPPTFERSADEWMKSREGMVADNTQNVANLALSTA